MGSLPLAGSVPLGYDKEKITSQAKRKFSGSLANDTKWNELIDYVRCLDSWRPSYRCKWVMGHVSEWDTEWFYHLPFPFVGVEWLDVGMHQSIDRGRWLEREIIDHTSEFTDLFTKIGFEFEVWNDVVRVWGYAPKSYDYLLAVES